MPDLNGADLINRVLPEEQRQEVLSRALLYPRLKLDDEKVNEVYNVCQGVYSPLEGFQGSTDFRSVVHSGRLSNGQPWTIPIVLDASAAEASPLKEGQTLCLWQGDLPLALMHLDEKYAYDKAGLASGVFGTTDPKHPGVARALAMGDVLLAGKLDLLQDPDDPYSRHKLTPVQTRQLFRQKGWRTVVGFQTRNVPHLGHEYVQKTALSFVDGLFINPVIGKKKAGDFRDEVILDSYVALMEHYYLPERVTMSVLRQEMRYAGPREAIFHAIVRKNFGCTHFIVGRDHAGVGNYYTPYAAQEIFQDYPDLGITPLFFTAFFYCRKCGSVANEKTCPHDGSLRIDFSGTWLRKVLMEKGEPPAELLRPEVADAVRKWEHPLVEEA